MFNGTIQLGIVRNVRFQGKQDEMGEGGMGHQWGQRWKGAVMRAGEGLVGYQILAAFPDRGQNPE